MCLKGPCLNAVVFNSKKSSFARIHFPIDSHFSSYHVNINDCSVIVSDGNIVIKDYVYYLYVLLRIFPSF